MIAQIRGRLTVKEPHRIVVDVNGVGYLVFIPLSTFYRLPEVPGEVFLHTHTHVRDDAIQLFGFHTRDEQVLFELLQGVTGIGPRLATNILSGISADELIPALSEGDLARLRAVPGVGEEAGRTARGRITRKGHDAWPAAAGRAGGRGRPRRPCGGRRRIRSREPGVQSERGQPGR